LPFMLVDRLDQPLLVILIRRTRQRLQDTSRLIFRGIFQRSLTPSRNKLASSAPHVAADSNSAKQVPSDLAEEYKIPFALVFGKLH
jgi:hypothetical protein